MLKQGHNLPRRHRGPFFRIFALGVPFLAVAFGAISAPLSASATRANALGANWTPNEKEELVSHTSLAVTASSSTLTSTTQSISVSFRSRRIETWPNGAANKNVYILPNDPEWVDPGRFDQKEGWDGHPITDDDYPRYPASVFNINTYIAAVGSGDHIVVPTFVRKQKSFILDVVNISADCCFDPKTDLVDYEGIKEIVIPATIETIEEGAFMDLPDDVTILCEAPEFVIDEETGDFALDDDGFKIPTYPGTWTDGTVVYNYQLTGDDKGLLTPNTTTSVAFGSGEDFYLGIESDDYYFPLYMEYQYETLLEDGSYALQADTYMKKLDLVSTNNPYDAVGTTMGRDEIVKNIDIPVSKGTRVNADSIKFHNIYRVDASTRAPSIKDPDLYDGWNGELYAEPAIAFTLVPHFEQFFSIKPSGVATYGDFLRFSVDLYVEPGESGYGLYSQINPEMFAANKKNLDSGLCQTRYQFSSLDQSYYRFTYGDPANPQTVTVRLGTPVKYVLVNKGSVFNMGFLVNTADIEGVTTDNILGIELCGFVIKSDIYNNDTHSIVTRSSISLRFARLQLFEDFQNVHKTNVVLIIALTYIIYVAAFLAGAVGYYFFAKYRYRNDEFHRMNLKKYLIAASKNFAGFALVTSAILFIVCRWGIMNNTVVVFNPIDPLVTIFTILGAIYLGFFIRDIVLGIKNARKRRQALRLRLDEDVVEDGTK